MSEFESHMADLRVAEVELLGKLWGNGVWDIFLRIDGMIYPMSLQIESLMSRAWDMPQGKIKKFLIDKLRFT